ncbi:autotransporter outer membrane beta-barrel domain-containing protein [Prosthecomicrobium pneumaticum]|uniref:Outer membrane autotransporter protein n=1 Tax=Prosthecomicrobium pneumaticum TaxID=81895 RepID=A0A7W9CUL3_9HYPH|nr:autotransporter domain-containing protein [Prosthecomicrobium pneumaticum]MBB5751806.1 outer membrane autotransporter protein [Prosthecomicrobium pneumaticum]
MQPKTRTGKADRKVIGRRATPFVVGAGLVCIAALPAAAVEPWIMVEKTTFADADQSRGQGVTTDGVNWYFSGTNSLERTDGSFNTGLIVNPAIPNVLAIPSALSDAGLNHIGDIDYADGYLYISLDSSQRDPVSNEKYENPVFAIYNASDLTYTGQAFALNPPHGVHDIASWVAVDVKNGLGYGMAYENATELTVYNLADWSFKEYIPLSQTIDQAQGGKLLDGWMYFATDNDEKLIYRANVKTGEVELLGNLKIDGEQEVEGLSFRQTADGWTLNILNREENVDTGNTDIGFYSYLRPYGNALSGEIHASAKGALIEDGRLLRDAADGRLRSAYAAPGASAAPVSAYGEGGIAAAPATAGGLVIWSEALTLNGKADAAGYAAAFDHSTSGFLIGADAALGGWRVGLMTGFSATDFDVDARSSSGSSDNVYLGLYGGTEWGRLGFRTGASYAWHSIETKRDVVFPAFSERLSADYDAGSAQAFGELGYRIDVPHGALEPFAGLAYVHLDTDGFSETGGTTAALSSEDAETDTVFTTLGLRASTGFAVGDVKVTLRGMAGWQHAEGDVTPDARLTFGTGASFDSVGTPMAKNALVTEAGFDLALSPNASLGASYAGHLGDDTEGHTFKIGLDLKL